MGGCLIVGHKSSTFYIGIFLKIKDCERGLSDIQVNTGTATPSLHTGSEAWVRRKGEKTEAVHMRFLILLLEVSLQPE
jgi:hypothetical protein